MAQITRVGRKRPPKKKGLRVSSSVLQWSIVAVVAVAMLFLLIRALVNRPGDAPPIPTLANAHEDLATVTRMLGDVELDSATRALFPSELAPKFKAADTLTEQGRWTEAIGSLHQLLRQQRSAEVAAVRAYLAYCYRRAASPDYSLMHLRKSLALADTSLPALVPWLTFSIGYLFQSHGMNDSALVFYRRCDEALPAGARRDRVALLNNIGVALEATGARPEAAERLGAAAALLDSTDLESSRRTVTDNLARAAAPAKP
jgi:tetratricopeptide (TPR) repeat protein